MDHCHKCPWLTGREAGTEEKLASSTANSELGPVRVRDTGAEIPDPSEAVLCSLRALSMSGAIFWAFIVPMFSSRKISASAAFEFLGNSDVK